MEKKHKEEIFLSEAKSQTRILYEGITENALRMCAICYILLAL